MTKPIRALGFDVNTGLRSPEFVRGSKYGSSQLTDRFPIIGLHVRKDYQGKDPLVK